MGLEVNIHLTHSAFAYIYSALCGPHKGSQSYESETISRALTL